MSILALKGHVIKCLVQSINQFKNVYANSSENKSFVQFVHLFICNIKPQKTMANIGYVDEHLYLVYANIVSL